MRTVYATVTYFGERFGERCTGKGRTQEGRKRQEERTDGVYGSLATVARYRRTRRGEPPSGQARPGQAGQAQHTPLAKTAHRRQCCFYDCVSISTMLWYCTVILWCFQRQSKHAFVKQTIRAARRGVYDGHGGVIPSSAALYKT